MLRKVLVHRPVYPTGQCKWFGVRIASPHLRLSAAVLTLKLTLSTPCRIRTDDILPEKQRGWTATLTEHAIQL
jgi:hypothetical protein